jgi:hypothetical protein
MLCRLAVEARCHAVKAFSALALWENQRVLRLARRTFPAVRIACAAGSCELTLDLEPVSEVELTAEPTAGLTPVVYDGHFDGNAYRLQTIQQDAQEARSMNISGLMDQSRR